MPPIIFKNESIIYKEDNYFHDTLYSFLQEQAKELAAAAAAAAETPATNMATKEEEQLLVMDGLPSSSSHTISTTVHGRIIRKRKHHTGIAYAIQPMMRTMIHPSEEEEEKETTTTSSSSRQEESTTTIAPPPLSPPVLVLVPRNDPCVAWCFVGAVVTVDFAEATAKCQQPTASGVFIPNGGEEKKDDDRRQTHNKGDTTTNDIDNNNGDAASTMITTTATATSGRQRKHLRDAERVTLIQCSPDPNAIVACLELVLDGTLALSPAFPMMTNANNLQTLLRQQQRQQDDDDDDDDVDKSDNNCQDNSDDEQDDNTDIDDDDDTFKRIRALLDMPVKDEGRRNTILNISRVLQDNNDHSHNNHKRGDDLTTPLPTRAAEPKFEYGTAKPRPPKIKRRFWFVLQEMERTIPRLQPLQKEALATTMSTTGTLNVSALEEHLASYDDIPAQEDMRMDSSLPLPRSPNIVVNVPDVHAMSNKHQISRMDYMKLKKWPQVRWLLQRLQQMITPSSMYATTTTTTTTTCDVKTGNGDGGVDDVDSGKITTTRRIRILDVGGGRGDLAVAMAQSFPKNVHVTVVDVNQTSLEAGQAFAEHTMGKTQADRQTRWHCADFAQFAADEMAKLDDSTTKDGDLLSPPFDIVVAWHACGDLSDYALEFATRTSASFIICPCCYTKRYIDGFQARWIGDYLSGWDFDPQPLSYCPLIEETTSFSSNHAASPASRPYTETMEADIVAVQRMAEINEHIQVSQRAMLLINSMRLISLSQQQLKQQTQTNGACRDGKLQLSLEQYDIRHSSKNLVLVGSRK